MIGMAVIPQPGANYVSIADEFYKRVEQIKKDMPEDIKVDVLFDTSKFIKQSISEVEETLMIAVAARRTDHLSVSSATGSLPSDH